MDNELLTRDLKSIENSLDHLLTDAITRLKWFMSFGSLLYLIRDKKHGIPFETDVDISIIGEHNYNKINGALLSNEFRLERHIKDDCTGATYFASYVSPNNLHLDLFFWQHVGNNYWHTYDYYADAKDGIPSKYHWKSTPSYMLDGDTQKFPWSDDISPLKIPLLYGTLLDYWYGNWYFPNSEFGVSLTENIIECKSCSNLAERLSC